MSVTFNVRAVDPQVVATLRANPALAELLCAPDIDFDAAAYEAEVLRGVPDDRREARKASQAPRIQRMVAARDEALAELRDAGVDVGACGPALDLGRSWWGMKAMIDDPSGSRLIDESYGEAIGEDLGLGPARLLSPADLLAMLPSLDVLTRDMVAPRFRRHEAEDAASRASTGLETAPRATDAELDEWAWLPLCRLRDVVRAAAARGAWILRWYI